MDQWWKTYIQLASVFLLFFKSFIFGNRSWLIIDKMYDLIK